ncbi:MAG: DUF1684 domain-containing protein [Hymenobacter sp.]|nr:DUF1684 domain-containing protein [Hymenobacter sp.]
MKTLLRATFFVLASWISVPRASAQTLDPGFPVTDRQRLDFNQAYNPFCAHNFAYPCPVPPAENHPPVITKAGVMSDH